MSVTFFIRVGNVISVSATFHSPWRLISSFKRLFKLANEFSLKMFIDAVDTKVTVKESLIASSKLLVMADFLVLVLVPPPPPHPHPPPPLLPALLVLLL